MNDWFDIITAERRTATVIANYEWNLTDEWKATY